ncbi:MAG: GxxExxY protein [Mucilaginibacter sp.]|uniref:GxxExxY protein n=1 Tax=Mucilaginibacter sp. TaxID=1882438 RepID=UPI00260AA197|nr:GxxExxY protein [Mucilaginibacter sp.]MDB5004301.1 GxxExxY protein [Mucilaginibacter sp.]
MDFQEFIYQRALSLEFVKAGLNFQRELEVPIYYKDHLEPIGTRRVDFLVEGIVVVELKARVLIEDIILRKY